MQNAILLVILVVLTVLAYSFMVFSRGKRASRFGNLKTLERVEGAKRFQVSPIILLSKVIIISLLFLVATGSLEVRELKPASNTDYVILLDSSSSMAKTDFNPNRLTAAKQIAKQWLGNTPNGTRIGFIAFSQDLSSIVEPTFDQGKVRNAIDNIEIDYSKSGTSLVYALSYGVNLLNNSPKKRAILLMTDGTDEIDEDTIAYAVSQNVKIFSFGIGSEDDILQDQQIPEEYAEFYNTLEFNFSKLEELSDKTDGRAYNIGNVDELSQSFDDATLEDINIQLNSSYYIVLLIALLSILELLVYSKFGGL